MKKIYAILFLLFACGFAVAQNFSVTFQVDMGQVGTIADTVSVAGNFQAAAGFPSDWTPGSTILTDGNGDNVFDLTVQLPAGTYQYKFINGTAWGQDEGVPGACAVGGNREVVVSGNTTIPVVCFAQCAACPTSVDTVNVTFQVRMSNQTVGDTVSVAGDFQDDAVGMGWSAWTPGLSVLTDPDMNGVYEMTVRLPEGTYQYKFVNGTAWGQDEAVPCACGVNNNREVVVVGPNDITIPVVCFGECGATCSAAGSPSQVTFRVDMTNEIVNSGGVFVAGSFQNPAWVKDTLEMTDPDGDGIYTRTETITTGSEFQYKYYNGPNGDPDGESADFLAGGCGCSNGLGGFNRLLDLTLASGNTVLPAFIYNTCDPSPLAIGDKIDANRVQVFPNPFTNQTVIVFENAGQPYNVMISTVEGRQVRAYDNLTNRQLTVERGDLNAGIYFATILTQDGAKYTHKLLIH